MFLCPLNQENIKILQDQRWTLKPRVCQTSAFPLYYIPNPQILVLNESYDFVEDFLRFHKQEQDSHLFSTIIHHFSISFSKITYYFYIQLNGKKHPPSHLIFRTEASFRPVHYLVFEIVGYDPPIGSSKQFSSHNR